MSMGSIYSSLSSLLSFSKALENSSNNVSNLNTPGYKGRDVRFSELANFSEGDTTRNEGAKIQDSQLRFQNGDISETGNDTDLAIDGLGFFILRTGSEELYTRAGGFKFDSNGFLIDPETGYRVAGIDGGGNLVDISIKNSIYSEPEKTTQVSLSGNLDSGTLAGSTVNSGADSLLEFDVVDNLGTARKLQAVFEKQLGNQWTLQFIDQSGNPVGAKEAIHFTSDGHIRSEDKNYSVSYFPYRLQTAEQTKEVFTLPGEFNFTDSDLTTGGTQSFTLSDDVYFITRDETGGNVQFVGSGQFSFTEDGYLVNTSDMSRVAGIGTEGTLTDLNISDLVTNPAQPTNQVSVSGNLDPDLSIGSVVPAVGDPAITFEITQSDGSHMEIHTEFTKQDDQEWEVVFRNESGTLLAGPLALNYEESGLLAAESRVLTATFPDSDEGTLSIQVRFHESTTNSLTQISGSASSVSFDANGTDEGDIESLNFTEEGFVEIHYTNGNTVEGPRIAIADRSGSAVSEFEVSLEGLTSLSGINSVEIADVDGRSAGRLTAYSFNESGQMTLNYSNGESVDGPTVALANFVNINGLTGIGETLFKADKSAGRFIAKAGEKGLGKIQGKSIELSNVELSREFAEIIIIQRGYQASSQIMNVSNELIETLYNNVRGR
ncbi:flagellar biosynthesis protein FlgE [Hahella sp. CCB-MM4]|uniref:flagellar hook-basal body complex protein n=1 Tax=Hahella sp. (strain CCB-MM4) TaxID=1926491 RepID=UPI000B9B5E14|nr:flagellar hook-basal body complex protein [Hahella sp. CCB-MM4]OZG74839.1 flagellar biosynthesis protein FlgE [Hahella sp. CCB-MM4]